MSQLCPQPEPAPAPGTSRERVLRGREHSQPREPSWDSRSDAQRPERPSSSTGTTRGPPCAGHSLLHIPAPGPVAPERDGANGHDEDDDHVVVQHGLVGGVQRCPHCSAKILCQRMHHSSGLGPPSPAPHHPREPRPAHTWSGAHREPVRGASEPHAFTRHSHPKETNSGGSSFPRGQAEGTLRVGDPALNLDTRLCLWERAGGLGSI